MDQVTSFHHVRVPKRLELRLGAKGVRAQVRVPKVLDLAQIRVPKG